MSNTDAQTAVSKSRAFAINMYQSVQIIGVIIASGVVFASSVLTTKSAFLIPMGVQLIAPGLILITSPWLPESPRWLIWKGRFDEAVKSADTLFSGPGLGFDANDYCTKLSVAFEEERQWSTSTGWADLFQGPDLRRMAIAVGIQCLQQAQGSSYMNSYIASFLEGTGVTNVFPVIMGLYCVYYVSWP